MKNKWLIIAVLFPVLSFSQANVSRGEITAITTVGFAGGESTAKPLYQFSAGITFDRWFTGIGFGLDQYRFNSLPLFADCRMSFGKTRLGFLYANAGYNFPGRHTGEEDNFFKTTDKLLGGFYMDAGIGCRIRLNPLHRLLFSAGYSQKHVGNKIGYTYPCLVPPCPEEVYDYRYQLGRIVTKISWEFGRSK